MERSEMSSWVKSIGFAVVLAWTARYFFFAEIVVHGESMLPTFAEADKVLVTKTTDIERFDQIVFTAPDGNDNYIKRVIGMPGDALEVKDDILYINGKATEEPYIEDSKKALLPDQNIMGDFTLSEATGYKKIPEGYLFVMGDNRLVSKDSRAFGLIPESSLIGEVQLRFYPFTDIQLY